MKRFVCLILVLAMLLTGISASASDISPEDVMQGIAAAWLDTGLLNNGRYPWIIADLEAYSRAFPGTELKLSAEEKQACLDAIIAAADKTSDGSELAKYIIALRSMGYDAAKAVTADGRGLDMVARLTAFIDAKDNSVTGAYTFPYVFIALQQGEGYLSSSRLEDMLGYALSDDFQAAWQDTTYGVDGVTPMVLALAPYYDRPEVKSVVDKALMLIEEYQRQLGSADLGNPSSDGLAIAALAAMSRDTVPLTDALLKYADDNLTGFDDGYDPTYPTEQGFMGLVSAALGGRAYDFASYPMAEARASLSENCSVHFSVIPGGAEITVRRGDKAISSLSPGRYDLPEGKYSYSAEKEGYITAKGEFEISVADISAGKPITIKVSLATEAQADAENISVNIKVVIHDENKCAGKFTYKHNRAEFETVLAQDTLTMKKGQSVFDALALLLDANGIDYEEKTPGYLNSIGGLDEMGHGTPRSGWLYMVDGKVYIIDSRSCLLERDSNVVWFYTDDFSVDHGSETWNGQSLTPWNDVEKHWAYDSIVFAYERGLMSGMTDTGFVPDIALSRAMIVTMLWRMEGCPVVNYLLPFEDVAAESWYTEAVRWAAAEKIVKGVSENTFAPSTDITREQLMAMLYNYAVYKGLDVSVGENTNILSYSDAFGISEYAIPAVQWGCGAQLLSGRTDDTIDPTGDATRAEAAILFHRFITNIVEG